MAWAGRDKQREDNVWARLKANSEQVSAILVLIAFGIYAALGAKENLHRIDLYG